MVISTAKKHGKCIVVTEEPKGNGFSHRIASFITTNCFKYLDAPVEVIGSENMPAIPLNSILEATMIPNANKVSEAIKSMLSY